MKDKFNTGIVVMICAVKLQNAFSTNYNYAVIKGEPLLKLAYGIFNKQKSTDIDFFLIKRI